MPGILSVTVLVVMREKGQKSLTERNIIQSVLKGLMGTFINTPTFFCKTEERLQRLSELDPDKETIKSVHMLECTLLKCAGKQRSRLI